MGKHNRFAGLMDARSGATAVEGETVTTNVGPCASLGRPAAAASEVTPTTNRSARSCGKTRTGT